MSKIQSWVMLAPGIAVILGIVLNNLFWVGLLHGMDKRLDVQDQYLMQSHEDMRNFIVSAERLKMYNVSLGGFMLVNGVYRNHQFYCVWTEGRSAEEIADTEAHEQCHALIDLEYDHFCSRSLVVGRGGDRT